MTSKVQPVPDGYHTVTACFTAKDAVALVEFLKRAFDAVEVFRMAGPDGRIRHAELRIGDSMVMLGQASEQWAPRTSSVCLYVPDCDATYRRALAAGARPVYEPATHFYGDRSGGVEDAEGNSWWIATHVEDVSPEEIERRAKAQGHA